MYLPGGTGLSAATPRLIVNESYGFEGGINVARVESMSDRLSGGNTKSDSVWRSFMDTNKVSPGIPSRSSGAYKIYETRFMSFG